MASTLHVAIMPCEPGHSPCVEGEHIMVSLDGRSWLEVTRVPSLEDAPTIARMFVGSGRTKPMTFARRYLTMRGARFDLPMRTA